MSGALIFMSCGLVFMADAQETPLDCLALVAKEACISGFHGTITMKEILGRLPPSGHCADSGLRPTSQSFYEGGLFACSRALA